MMIIGAGLSGLIAATQFQQARVYESNSYESITHRALLRFRSSAVSDATGIPFRKVRVHKGIYFGDKFCEPNILLANYYARKVVGRIIDRSIWDTAPCDRFVAPDNFSERLIEQIGERIVFDHPITNLDGDDRPLISTIPMPAMFNLLGWAPQIFDYARIHTSRIVLDRTDVFQTIYFPSPEISLYRASITGNLLILEGVRAINDDDLRCAMEAFGLTYDDIIRKEPTAQQAFGKITPIDDVKRRNAIYAMSQERQIYSLGRFACWRNILLDDVIKDITVIKRLLAAKDGYESAKLTIEVFREQN